MLMEQLVQPACREPRERQVRQVLRELTGQRARLDQPVRQDLRVQRERRASQEKPGSKEFQALLVRSELLASRGRQVRLELQAERAQLVRQALRAPPDLRVSKDFRGR